MGAEEPIIWKVFDILIVVAIFLTLLGGSYAIYTAESYVHVKTTKDATLFRDSVAAAPHKVTNAELKFDPILIMEELTKNQCKIYVQKKGKSIFEECNNNQVVQIKENIKQPQENGRGGLDEGVYSINVNV